MPSKYKQNTKSAPQRKCAQKRVYAKCSKCGSDCVLFNPTPSELLDLTRSKCSCGGTFQDTMRF